MALKEVALLFFVGDFRTVTVKGVLIKRVSFGCCQLWMQSFFFSFFFSFLPTVMGLLSNLGCLHFAALKVYSVCILHRRDTNVNVCIYHFQ